MTTPFTTIKNYAAYPNHYEDVIAYHEEDNKITVWYREGTAVYKAIVEEIAVQGQIDRFVTYVSILNDYEIAQLVLQFHHVQI